MEPQVLQLSLILKMLLYVTAKRQGVGAVATARPEGQPCSALGLSVRLVKQMKGHAEGQRGRLETGRRGEQRAAQRDRGDATACLGSTGGGHLVDLRDSSVRGAVGCTRGQYRRGLGSEVQSSLALFHWAFSKLSLLVLTRGPNPNSGCRVCANNKDPASNPLSVLRWY